MRYIERVVWKPLDGNLDAPNQYGAGTPGSNARGLTVDLGDGRMLTTSASFTGPFLTIALTGGLRISIPAETAPDVAEAILYAHRRAHVNEQEAH